MKEKGQSTSAATVILLRDVEPGGFEAFLTRRPDKMPFFGGTYGFPGGAVRKEDCSAGLLSRCDGIAPRVARKILGSHFTPQEALGFWVAGIRVLLEEVGILLAVNQAGRPWVRERVEDGPASQLASLLQDTLRFQSLLEKEGLFCDTSKLVYFSQWETSVPPSMRLDSRFFLAALPQGQTVPPKLSEVVHGLWLTPDQALKRFAKEELPMIFPTFASLRTLADFESLDSVLTEYRTKAYGSLDSKPQ
jgi:8-oxo-dGTP pyrophosphatase MutT (NUDIX family)